MCAHVPLVVVVAVSSLAQMTGADGGGGLGSGGEGGAKGGMKSPLARQPQAYLAFGWSAPMPFDGVLK